MKKSITILLVPIGLLLFSGANNPMTDATETLKAAEVVSRIQENLNCDWQKETVDTFKSGSPNSEVTGIATTFLATMEMLKKAKASGLNLIITHEPTYYNHFDHTEQFEGDEVVAAKQKYIKENGLIVWRFHDHWHQTSPDGIYMGMVAKLGWQEYELSKRPYVYKLPQTTVKELARQLNKRFQKATVRVVGDPEMKMTNASLVLGAPGSMPQIKSLQRDDVEVMIGGETREWETVEYVRDAVNMGKKKALILVGHANSEEAGMDYCAEWLKTFVSEVPVEFIPAGDPFWTPDE